MANEFAIKFFERLLGPMELLTPVPVTGWRAIVILWPLNDVFRPHLARIQSIRYRTRFEPEADRAIERFAYNPDPATWDDVSPGAWRVLLERHQQIIKVLMTNETVGNIFTALPSGLPQFAELPAVMLLLLHQMKLQWPPEDRSRLELPEGPPPASMTLH